MLLCGKVSFGPHSHLFYVSTFQLVALATTHRDTFALIQITLCKKHVQKKKNERTESDTTPFTNASFFSLVFSLLANPIRSPWTGGRREKKLICENYLIDIIKKREGKTFFTSLHRPGGPEGGPGDVK